MLYATLLWLSTSLVVGYIGRKRALGFWGVFLFSLAFSPAVGLLALLVARSDQSEFTRKQQLLVQGFKKRSDELSELQKENSSLKQQIDSLKTAQQQVPGTTTTQS